MSNIVCLRPTAGSPLEVALRRQATENAEKFAALAAANEAAARGHAELAAAQRRLEAIFREAAGE